jgi:hypothetical protein
VAKRWSRVTVWSWWPVVTDGLGPPTVTGGWTWTVERCPSCHSIPARRRRSGLMDYRISSNSDMLDRAGGWHPHRGGAALRPRRMLMASVRG